MKRALVTGGSRGLGLAICDRLLRDGYQVVTCARTESAHLCQLRQAFPAALQYHSLDLGDSDAVAHFAKAAGVLDGFDAFVANAAVGVDGLVTLNSDEAIQRCIQVNLTSNILLARQVLKGMLGKGGALVFISSIAAHHAMRGLSVYAATKAGIAAFSRTIAREYGPQNIRSNCILPGYFESDLSSSLSPEQRAAITRRTPLGVLATPADIVGSVAFLLSDQARFITGAELTIDGGFSA